jgi:hypothetical protein
MSCLQKFASVHANVHNHFNAERHLAASLAHVYESSGASSRPGCL